METGGQAQPRAVDSHEHHHAQYRQSRPQERGLEAQEKVLYTMGSAVCSYSPSMLTVWVTLSGRRRWGGCKGRTR